TTVSKVRIIFRWALAQLAGRWLRAPMKLECRCRSPSLPGTGRAVRGRCRVNRKVAGACPAGREFPVYFLVVETQKKGRSMQFSNSTFVQLLKPINRRQFKEIVERHDGNAYDKSFKSWEHLVTLLYAQ